MAVIRVAAHCMHETEKTAALAALRNPMVAAGFVVGDIDSSAIPALQAQGLIVQHLPAPPLPELGDGLQAAGADTGYYLLGLSVPLMAQLTERLRAAGVEILEALEGGRYLVRCTLAAAGQVRLLAGVAWISPRRSVSLAAASPQPANRGIAGDPLRVYEILLHSAADLDSVRNRLQTLPGITITAARGRKLRFSAVGNSPLLRQIAQLAQVRLLSEWTKPKLHNDRARQLLRLDRPPANPAPPAFAWTGDGQIVAVADTGLDERHPDFANRIAGLVALGRPEDSSDPHGHGTHVAASVLGDGSASNGQIRGTAPEARLYFQSVLDGEGELGGLPMDLYDLFEPAYAAGCRIHNNSWGAATQSEYVINSLEVDGFVAERRDMLIVISAGNEGTSAKPQHVPPGQVDWLSIGSPASCKNALTVGASQSDRSSGGYAQRTYGSIWAGKFPQGGVADERVSGNAESMAAFSSRGPCTDRRIKPDVVAPGTDIVSARSSLASPRRYWGLYPGHADRYAYMGGTSMAAPLVAGCAALVRQFYQQGRGHLPSAALLKATLINGTRWLSAPSATAQSAAAPNVHQGFGSVDMAAALPGPADGVQLAFVDEWQAADAGFAFTGDRRRWRLRTAGGPLRVCLVWTDLPARALQNNLNLFVQDIVSGQKWTGNAGLPQALTVLDTENNVEIVRIDTVAGGDYLLQVTASNLLNQGGQDFALVVTGALLSELELQAEEE